MRLIYIYTHIIFFYFIKQLLMTADILQFLNFLQAKVRELKKMDNSSSTAALMLVGIPNTGKSALANSLHKIGRISAAGTNLLIASDARSNSFTNCPFYVLLGQWKQNNSSAVPLYLHIFSAQGHSSIKVWMHPNVTQNEFFHRERKVEACSSELRAMWDERY